METVFDVIKVAASVALAIIGILIAIPNLLRSRRAAELARLKGQIAVLRVLVERVKSEWSDVDRERAERALVGPS